MMYSKSILCVLIALICHETLADMYCHMPRGSNNRLNEQSANRNNGNRLFDSQNNNRGGYNVGDLDTTQGFDGANYHPSFAEKYEAGFWAKDGGNNVNDVTTTPRKQYEEFYWEQSWMPVTWTNQHGCNNEKLGCHILFSYLVENHANAKENGGVTDITTLTGSARYNTARRLGLRVMLTNGGNTNTPDKPNADNDIQNKYNQNNNNNRGRHESEEWYRLCERRYRNMGLFTADQKLNGNAPKYTRQNPGGTRRGLECPEERDYWPYWHPTPFIDAVILTSDVDYCNNVLAPQSNNVQTHYACTDPTTPNGQISTNANIHKANHNQTACTEAGGTWTGFSWNMPAPKCMLAPTTKVNHLGNEIGGPSDGGGSQAYFMWQLPAFGDLVNGQKAMGHEYTYSITKGRDASGTQVTYASPENRKCVRMVTRLLYNMSVMDYDPYQTNASMNEDRNNGVISPIEQNPTVDVGYMAQGLRLAINTAQTGRTFQDRSHTFLVCQRVQANANAKILNVQVQGKRGNIVQTFPATEYAFSPRQFTVSPGDYLHFQWTGSNTHNNGNPAGDGQAGDAGEGRGGSDRTNMIQMKNAQSSYPLTYDKFASEDFTKDMTCTHGVLLSRHPYSGAKDAQLVLGSGGFYQGEGFAKALYTNNNSNLRMDVLMNNVSASFRGGAMCRIKTPTAGRRVAFMSTRNNNFTNRAQKMIIVVGDAQQTSQWASGNGRTPDPNMLLG